MSARRLLPSLVAALLTALIAVPAEASPGDSLWTKTYDGPASGRDTPSGMAVDPVLHRVYVVGTTTASTGTTGTFTDIVTIAYDGYTGDTIWARRYDGPVHGSDLAIAIVYDPFSGGVTVTGGSESSAGTGQVDAVTIAYAADGSRRWVRRVTNPATDFPTDLTVIDGSTYVLVHGTLGRLIAYDSTGTRLWSRDAITAETLAGLTALESIGGYLLIVGRLYDADGHSKMYTLAYKTDGSFVWTKTFAGGSMQAASTDAAVGSTTLYVTGVYGDALSDIATIAYDPHNGTRLWRRSITRGANRPSGGPFVAVSPDGASIALATSVRVGLVDHFLTRRYLSDGSVDWTAREDEIDESGQPTDVAVGAGGNVYVTGSGTNSGATPGSITLAYPASGPPTAFQAAIANADVQDAGFRVAVDPSGYPVFVASRVGLDIRVDSYATG